MRTTSSSLSLHRSITPKASILWLLQLCDSVGLASDGSSAGTGSEAANAHKQSDKAQKLQLQFTTV